MVLFYSDSITNRLQYIGQFIFNDLLGHAIEFTTDEHTFKNFNGGKINYSHQKLDAGFQIIPSAILFETAITTQPIDCFEYKGNTAFFKSSSTAADFPFDIFAASFFLLSRYEEYLPHASDSYGRYAHENSVAFKKGFLDKPLIQIWVQYFSESLQQKYPGFFIGDKEIHPGNHFKFLPTYDIDIAFSYQHKGALRNLGGFIKRPTIDRLKVLAGLLKDPFDTYDWLDELHTAFQVDPIYFFLVSKKNGQYDKNILPSKKALQQLIAAHAKKYTIGIHPSWQSGDEAALLEKEKNILEEISGKPIHHSRQHYIRFNLPEGYQRLTDVGIENDYSMGYGSINGFRASVAAPFYWYNLKTDLVTNLLIHPFCFMEANAFYEQHLTASEALEEMNYYYKTCKNVNSLFISIWHNHFLGSADLYKGWGAAYETFMKRTLKK